MTFVQLIFIVLGMRGKSYGCSSSSAKVQKKIGSVQEGRWNGEGRELEGLAMNVFYILTKMWGKYNNKD